MTARIQIPTESVVVHYPEAIKFQDLQQNAFWTANEVNLEKDIQPLLTEMDEAEKHGVLTVLKLFTLYELRADEFWGDVIKNMFPRPEIQGMASIFSAMEKSVHLRVYDKLNKLLNVSDDEFYHSYQDSPCMKSRMEYLDEKLTTGSDLEKIAAFSFAEGAVLFSSFAYLMSFRANGNNKLPNIGLAVKFSARDEDLHNQGASWLFQTLKFELEQEGYDSSYLEKSITDMAHAIQEHEYEIIDEIFAKTSNGKMSNITEVQMRHFVDSRINKVLKRLGFKPVFKVTYNPIAEWFDKVIEAYQSVDFFAGQGSSYKRGWNKEGFTWNNG